MMKKSLAAALLALAAGVLPPQDGDPGATDGDVHIGSLSADVVMVASDLSPDNTQAKH
jgi:hypothetical protein